MNKDLIESIRYKGGTLFDQVGIFVQQTLYEYSWSWIYYLTIYNIPL